MREKSIGIRAIINQLKFSLKKILILRKLRPKLKKNRPLVKETIIFYLLIWIKKSKFRNLKFNSLKMILLISVAINNLIAQYKGLILNIEENLRRDKTHTLASNHPNMLSNQNFNSQNKIPAYL